MGIGDDGPRYEADGRAEAVGDGEGGDFFDPFLGSEAAAGVVGAFEGRFRAKDLGGGGGECGGDAGDWRFKRSFFLL